MSHFSLVAFKFFLWFNFQEFVGIVFFGFIMFGVCSASWIYKFTSFENFGNFPAILEEDLLTFQPIHFFFSSSETLVTQCLDRLW